MEQAANQVRHIPSRVDFLRKWLRFTNFNAFIENTNIIPFKCPLAKKYDEYLEQSEIFHFQHVYDYSVKINKPITDIIDLTFTYKYYTPKKENFHKNNVEHHKYLIPGKKLPNEEMLNEILDKMHSLIQNNKVIGVHCTHGINRTGFIICSYLVRKHGWEPSLALKAFETARGFPMEYQEYIDAVRAIPRLLPSYIENKEKVDKTEEIVEELESK